MAFRARFAALLAVAALTGCGDAEKPASPDAVSDAGMEHIHGLGVDPADSSVFVATHSGLFRVAPGESEATRVGDSRQDTMGFAVVGPNEFLGSGHPDPREDLPPLLGLIRSTDAGESWTPVSLLGEADFHVLRPSGSTVYGYDSSNGRLMVSVNRGRSWSERPTPAPIIDLAIDPREEEHVLASTQAGLATSRNGGRSWNVIDEKRAGLLAWTEDAVTLVGGNGRVSRSTDSGRSWKPVGDIGGQPAALSSHGRQLLVALHSNEVKESRDGGRSWQARISP